jgi:hypothetical protein
MNDRDRPLHVLPINDLKEHIERYDCWCKPQIIAFDENGELLGVPVISHNALDGRE